MVYVNIPKPTGGSYTKISIGGNPSYDEPTVLYDDPLVYYDGFDSNMYTNISKPGAQSYTDIAKPT